MRGGVVRGCPGYAVRTVLTWRRAPFRSYLARVFQKELKFTKLCTRRSWVSTRKKKFLRFGERRSLFIHLCFVHLGFVMLWFVLFTSEYFRFVSSFPHPGRCVFTLSREMDIINRECTLQYR